MGGHGVISEVELSGNRGSGDGLGGMNPGSIGEGGKRSGSW